MPSRARVFTFPEEFRDRLDEKLRAAAFSGFAEIAAWTQDQGHPMSRASVQRYSSVRFKVDLQDSQSVASQLSLMKKVRGTPRIT